MLSILPPRLPVLPPTVALNLELSWAMLVFEVGDHHSLAVESDVHRELFVLRLSQAIFVLLVHRLELDVGRL